MRNKLLLVLAFLFAIVGIFGCGDSSTSPTSPGPTQPPALNIHGSVTSYAFVPRYGGTMWGDINYVVTTTSNRAVSGCFVKVKWLDHARVQVDFTYAGADISIPQGTSTITDQHFMAALKAARIEDSIVEYTNCQ